MKKQLMITAMASSMVLAGCATNTGTSTGTNSNSVIKNRTVLGALAGAALGVGVSKATGGDKTVRDAAIGAAIGAGVGAYMQKQANQLKAQMAGTGVDVKIDPNTNDIKITMPSNITFDSNQYNIKSQFVGSLNDLSTTLNQYNKTNVVISGHTDSTGGDAINIPLSKNRANSVAQYLYGKGISETRLYVEGKGSSTPVASNATPVGRADNRRVEININAPKSLNQ